MLGISKSSVFYSDVFSRRALCVRHFDRTVMDTKAISRSAAGQGLRIGVIVIKADGHPASLEDSRVTLYQKGELTTGILCRTQA